MDGVWYGETAKYFESCKMSDEGNEDRRADFTTWKFLPQQADQMFLGTVNPASWTYCYCFPGLTTNCQYNMGAAAVGSQKPTVGAVETFASGFYQKMWDYVDEHYSEEKKHIDLWPLNGESILPVLPGLW